MPFRAKAERMNVNCETGSVASIVSTLSSLPKWTLQVREIMRKVQFIPSAVYLLKALPITTHNSALLKRAGCTWMGGCTREIRAAL